RRCKIPERVVVACHPANARVAMLVSPEPHRAMRGGFRRLQRLDERTREALRRIETAARGIEERAKLQQPFRDEPHAAELLVQAVAAFQHREERLAPAGPEIAPRSDCERGELPGRRRLAAHELAQRVEPFEAFGYFRQPDT